MTLSHIAVFKNEILESLQIKQDGNYADFTLGDGGHAMSVWEQLETGNLIVIDVDLHAIESFRDRLKGDSEQLIEKVWKVAVGSKTCYLLNHNFAEIGEVMQQLDLQIVFDGIVMDLGWSTTQLETIPGLSHSNPESELDMRLSPELGVKAADLVNALYPKELEKLFENYADLDHRTLKNLVNTIVSFRQQQQIKTVADLLKVIELASGHAVDFASHPEWKQNGTQLNRSLPARVFQALRIAVNNELSTLQSGLEVAWNALASGGSMLVITFHSGEEKVVTDWVAKSAATYLFTEKFKRPTVAELNQNLRARSAKLWGFSK